MLSCKHGSGIYFVFSQAGLSLGFNLSSSLAAIEQWVDAMESEDEEVDSANSQGIIDSISNRKTSKSQKRDDERHRRAASPVPFSDREPRILTRESIISMVRNLFSFIFYNLNMCSLVLEFEFQSQAG